MMLSQKLFLILAACQAWVGVGKPGFLLSALNNSMSHVEQAAFLDKLEEVLGPGRRNSTESQLIVMMDTLEATYIAMPKTARGHLSKASARYAIHRLFVERHGWHIKGVAPEGGPWQPPSPALGFGIGLPPVLQALLEEYFGIEDFALDELALLAATIEALIHSESVGWLHATYKVLNKDPLASLNRKEAEEVIYMCLTAHLTGYNISNLSRASLEARRISIEKDFPQWKRTRFVIREMQQRVASQPEIYTFSDVERVLETVNENMGRRVDEGACQDIEDKLIELQESADSGRVRLADFYASYLESGTLQFTERPEFLREQGALDESDPWVPRIVIPNYLTMKSNCLNVSTYYDLCCVDLCEDLMDTLELEIKAPQASPDQIMKVLRASESAYVRVGREWTKGLVNKLNEVAEHHGGQVPLHGRLFAQWLHFAYPNECPYPHLSGSTKPAKGTEWQERTGMSSQATKEEMLAIINATKHALGPSKCVDSEEGMCMWVPEEELVDAANWHAGGFQAPAAQKPAKLTAISGLRIFAFLATFLSSCVAMRNALQQMATIIMTSGGIACFTKIAKFRSCLKFKVKGDAFNV